MNIKKLIVTSMLMCLLPLSAYAKEIKIGVSMAYFDDNFLTILRQSMQAKMKEQGNVTGQFEDAKGDVAQQIQQVENFVSQGVDAIILNPVDTQAVKPMMKLAEGAKIPLVFVNRRPEVKMAEGMAYVGSDSALAGRLQMEELAKLMGGVGRITGTVIGAVILGLIKSGFTFIGVDSYIQDIIKGIIIVSAVSIDMYRNREKC